MRYQNIFDNRGNSYNAASSLCPDARKVERQLLIDRLELQADHSLCDAPAGGGYLADGASPLLRSPKQITCVEPSQAFMASGNQGYQWLQCELESLCLSDSSFDRFGSLAGLHHLSERLPFFQEAHRVIAPGGKIAVADVRIDSDVAHYLNGPVDQYTDTGHQGMFFREGEFSALLEQAGFIKINEALINFHWSFPDHETMLIYCKKLFGLHKASLIQVEKDLESHLNISNQSGETLLEWSLIYADASK